MKKIDKPYTTEQLYTDYVINNLKREEIAKKYKISVYLIDHDIHNYNIFKPKEQLDKINGGKIEINYDQLYNYYIIQNHNTEDTAKFFNVHDRTIRRRLKEYDIKKSVESQQELSKETQIKKYGDLFVKSDFYHSNIKEKMLKNMKKTCFQKYGVDNVNHVDEFIRKKAGRYLFDNLSFDSSYELALYIYSKDHKEEIKIHPVKFKYYIGEQIHYYIPDFYYRNQYIEIKGEHLINDDKVLSNVYKKSKYKDEAKQKCINDNNVVVWTKKDIQYCFDYINQKYGKNYLKTFKKI